MAIDINSFTRYMDDEKLITLIDDQTNQIFIGHSRQIDPATSSAVWLIGRALVDAGNVIQFQWATDREFDQVWDDRGNLFPGAAFANNTSILCDGVDDHILIGNVADLSFDIADPFSISMWFRSTFTGTGERILFSKQGSSNNAGYRMAVQSNQIRFHLSAGTGTNRLEIRTSDPITPNDDAWHHVVCTYDGSGNDTGVNIFFDNIQVNTTSNAQSSIVGSTVTAVPAQYSGRNGTLNEWEGFLDEISVFDIALNGTQVSEVYNSGVPGDISLSSIDANNVGWWRHDGDNFPIILDQGSNTSNDATMTNMTITDLVGEVP